MGKVKPIAEFDFDFNPKINRQRIMQFISCEFIRKNENILFVGPTSVEKTFLAKAVAHEACCKGFSVLFYRTMKMLEYIYSGSENKLKGVYQVLTITGATLTSKAYLKSVPPGKQ